MTSENNSLPLNLQEVDKTTGEVVKLDVNSTSTVQPVALMRLGLFVPTLKSTSRVRQTVKTSQMPLRSSYSCPSPKAKGTPTLRSPVRVLIWTRILKSGSGSFARCLSMG